MRINNNNNINFKNLSAFARPLGAFYNANATVPTLLIESGVTLGRSYEANKRGGKKEASERLVEQGISALVWIYGVQALQKINEAIGKVLFKNESAFRDGVSGDEKIAEKIKNFQFDVGFDKNKNPIKDNNINPKIANFKIGSLIGATAFATYFIGFILPKINHKISSKLSKKDNKEENSQTILKKTTFCDFQNQTKKKPVSFTSIRSLAHILENKSTARLFITDTGVIAGRYKNGRNKYERIEGLFRDISSIFFYLKSTDLIVRGLNKVTDVKNINPKGLGAILKLVEENENKQDLINKLKNLDDTFLSQVVSDITNGASEDCLRYVSDKKITSIKQSVSDYANILADKLKDVDEKDIYQQAQKIINKNIVKNFAFYALGTVISTFALGILIPKVQYFITKKLTNKNEFPDMCENNKNN